MPVEMFIYQKPDHTVYVIPRRYRITAPYHSRSRELTRRVHNAMIGPEPRSYEVSKDILTCQIEEEDLLAIAREFDLEIEDMREAGNCLPTSERSNQRNGTFTYRSTSFP